MQCIMDLARSAVELYTPIYTKPKTYIFIYCIYKYIYIHIQRTSGSRFTATKRPNRQKSKAQHPQHLET
ncbi:uncharacterized protein Dyak_GE28977 [Drosophila yakuba]|uniref:Uncharacterized protein n=1 Tax=Drosophila yakuba TaxID=7245 RepID=A0A0R1EG67_DROYA|nr:uncharacterized protein Dyak_GE28977 [Drosophila yakuba]